MNRFPQMSLAITTASFLVLSACGDAASVDADNADATAEDMAETTAMDTASADMPDSSGIILEETPSADRGNMAAGAAAAAPAAAMPIQTQPGPGGLNFDLQRAHVTGDIMTVQLRLTGEVLKCCKSELINLNEINIIDDSTAQRIGVLKDNSGQFMAAPLSASNAETLRVKLHEPGVIWFKFPAPPETTETVSINIPTIAPFDGVTVGR